MRVKTNVKAGGREINHNQAVKGLRMRSNVKAGGLQEQHNQTVKGLRVKTKVKAVNALALLVCALALAPAAQAQQSSWVSMRGSDSNPCTYALPCRTFNAALAAAATGQVTVKDSGSYDPMTVETEATIIAPEGVYAVIAPVGVPAVTINATQTATVTLRGLTLVGKQAATVPGVEVAYAARVRIESCVINDFKAGIRYEAAFPGELNVRDTVVGGGERGLELPECPNWRNVSIVRSRFENSHVGIYVGGKTRLAVRESTISGNKTAGLWLVAYQSYSPAQVVVEHSEIASNKFYGICANGSAASVEVSNSSILFSDKGLEANNSASIMTRGNNTLRYNTTDGVFTSGVLPK